MNPIQIQSLTLAYGEKPVVDNLNLHIAEGQITSLIGPNGCGKSTILKAAGRILKPKGGCVLLNGKDIHTLPTREVAQEISILPQSPQAPLGIAVWELVSYGRYPKRRGGRLQAEDEGIILWALEATGLLQMQNVPVDSLSGGQRQRVWIAMALAQQAGILLLDEPTTYLDMTYQLEILELLQKLNREQRCTIVMVLHDLNLASRYSDKLVAVRDGRIVAQGTPEEVLLPHIIRETFGIEAEIAIDPRSKHPVCISYHLPDKERNAV